jgi:hypothetical protein
MRGVGTPLSQPLGTDNIVHLITYPSIWFLTLLLHCLQCCEILKLYLNEKNFFCVYELYPGSKKLRIYFVTCKKESNRQVFLLDVLLIFNIVNRL